MQSRPRPLLIGLDVGTSHVKAALVSPDDRVLHVARRPTPITRSRGGLATHPADVLLAEAEAAVAECASAAGDRPVEAIGIASMAEAGTLVAGPDEPIGPVIAWFDPRSEPEAAELEAAVGAPELFATTGLRAHGKYSLPKLMWLARHRPAEVARATGWAGVAELVAVHLAGRLATNASLACRTLGFDVSARAWSPDLLGFASFSAEKMPEVLPFGRPAGGLRPAVAARLGLRAGIPVVVAGHDHVVGALAAGVVEPGEALDSMGTAEACLVVTERPVLADELRQRGYSVGCHIVDDRSYVLAGLQASGALVEWFIDGFLGDLPDAERYPRFMDLVAQAGDGPSRVLALPYLRGRTAPSPDPAARLELVNIAEGDGLVDIALALVDGASCAVRWIFDELEAATGLSISRTTVIGGGVRNARWLAAKAALSNSPVDVVAVEEAVAVGAALAGAVAAGLFESPGVATWRLPPRRGVQRPSSSETFDAYYRERFLPRVAGTAALPRSRTGQRPA